MVLLLLLLILIPVVAWSWAKRRRPERLWLITGTTFGAIVGPFCLGLYATFFLSPLGLITGLVGLLAGLFHGAPGYEIATFIGLVPSNKIVEGIDQIWISAVNAIVWGTVYGSLGWFIDWRRAQSTKNATV
jgi:hypothetical protein